MHFAILIVVILCLLTNLKFKVDSVHTNEGLELLFRQRSQSDWEDVWHQETHSRCRHKLLRHLYWACEKDIYRLTRRSGLKAISQKTPKSSSPLYLNDSKWLEKSIANTLLRSRNVRAPGSGPSITNECCTKIGCTWEEYAEYCPSNKRRNHF